MKLIFGMPDGSEWAVDPKLVAVDRANYYAGVDGHSIGSPEWDVEVGSFINDADTLADWAKSNMDWDELRAVMVKPPQADYATEYVNADCWLDAKV